MGSGWTPESNAEKEGPQASLQSRDQANRKERGSGAGRGTESSQSMGEL